jgi:hypothetical protein
VIRGPVVIVAREAPIDQIGTEVAFQLAEGEVLDLFEHAAPQKTVGSHSAPACPAGLGMPADELVCYELNELGVVKQVIDGIKQVVLEKRKLGGQWGVEERGLSRSLSEHVLDYIEYEGTCQGMRPLGDQTVADRVTEVMQPSEQRSETGSSEETRDYELRPGVGHTAAVGTTERLARSPLGQAHRRSTLQNCQVTEGPPRELVGS